MRAFILLRRMPGLERGSVFVYDELNESGLGSPGCGCLLLAWDNDNCGGTDENRWCGATFVLPGQLARDDSWFEEIDNPPHDQNIITRHKESHRYYVHIEKFTFKRAS